MKKRLFSAVKPYHQKDVCQKQAKISFFQGLNATSFLPLFEKIEIGENADFDKNEKKENIFFKKNSFKIIVAQ